MLTHLHVKSSDRMAIEGPRIYGMVLAEIFEERCEMSTYITPLASVARVIVIMKLYILCKKYPPIYLDMFTL